MCDTRLSFLHRHLSSRSLLNQLHVHVNVLRVVQVDLLFFLSLLGDLSRSRHIRFDVFSGHQIQQQSHLHVVSKSLYSQDNARSAVSFGVLDHRMVGVPVGGRVEGSCGQQNMQECLLCYYQTLHTLV